MKRILAILSVMGIVFFISGRVTAQTVNKPPIRTLDPHPAAVRRVTPSLPMKGGSAGGSKFVPLGAAVTGGAKTVAGGSPGGQAGTAKLGPPIKSASTGPNKQP